MCPVLDLTVLHCEDKASSSNYERKSYRFGITCGWVNNENVNFMGELSLKTTPNSLYYYYYYTFYSVCTISTPMSIDSCLGKN